MPTVQNFVNFGGDANEAVNAAKQYGEAVQKASADTVKLGKVVETVYPKVEGIVKDSLGNTAKGMVTPFKTLLQGVTNTGATFKRVINGIVGQSHNVTTEIVSDIEKLERRLNKFRNLTTKGAISAGQDKFTSRKSYENMWAGLLSSRDKEEAKEAEEARKAGFLAMRRMNREIRQEEKRLAREQALLEEGLRKEGLAGIRTWSRERKRMAKEQAAEEERLRKEGIEGIKEWSRAKKLAAREAAKDAREQAAEDARLRAEALAGIRTWSRTKREAERQSNRLGSLGAGDAMIGALGGIAPNATLAGRASMASISTSLENMIAKGKVSRTVMFDLFHAIKYNTLETYKLTLAHGQLTPEMKAAETAIRRLIASHSELNRAGTRTSEMLISFKGAMRILLVQQLHNVIRELTQSITITSAKSAEFYKSIGLIQTITQDTNISTKQWASSLRDLSTEFNIELLDASAAAYEAISNQVVNGGNSLMFLGKAFEFAKITGSTAKDSVNLLSSAINGFALNATHTDEITAKMFKTIDVGRVTASQMANVLGNVAPTAYLAGVSMDELLAGIATLTREGVRADTSITLMNNVITSMIKPSEELGATIRSWGYESGQAAIQGLKFHGVLKKLLEEEQKGGASRLGELFPNIRSLRASTGLIQDFSNSYVKSFEEISNATNEAAKASEIMGENSGVAFQRIQKSFSNTMVTRLGTELMEIVVELEKDFGGMANSIIPIVDGFSNIAHLSADVVMGLEDIDAAFNTLTLGQVKLTSTFSALIPSVTTTIASYYALSPILQLVSVRNEFLKTQMNNVLASSMHNVTWTKKLQVALMGYELNVHGATVANRAFATSMAVWTAGIPLAIGALAYLVSYSYDVRRQIDNTEEEVIGRLNKIYEKSIDALTKDLRARNKVLTDGLGNEMQVLQQYQAFVNRLLSSKVTIPGAKQFGADLNDANNIDNTVDKLSALERIMRDLGKKGRDMTLLGDVEGAGKAYDDLVKAAKDFNTELGKTSDKIKESISKLTEDKDESLLEKKLFGKKDAAKDKILIQEYNKLMDQAAKAGTKEEGLGLAGRAQGIAGKIDSAKRFDLEVKAIELQLKLQKELQDGLPSKIQQNNLLTEQEASEKRILDLKIQQREANAKILEYQKQLFQEQDKRTLARTEAQGKRDSLEGGIISKTSSSLAGINEKNFVGGETNRALGFSFISESYTKFIQQLAGINKELEHALKIDDKEKIDFLRKEIIRQSEVVDTLLERNQKNTFDRPWDSTSPSLYLTKEEFELEKARRKELLEMIKEYALQDKAVVGANADLAGVQGSIDKARLETQVAMQGLAGLKDLYKDIWDDVGKGVNGPIGDLSATVKALGENVKLLKETLSGQLGEGGIPTRASGGRIGRDGTTAKFDPREFVMNPMASQNFGPQLAAMNSNFNGGGSSSSSIVNIGDVIVNQNGGQSASQSAAEIGRALRREIARGTVRTK